MNRDSETYRVYIQILKEELVPAMGCTEPIAIAYGAAKARETLGALPDRVLVEASGNIIKNVKSVIVPNTGGMKGIEAAAAVGIVAGQADRSLLNMKDIFDFTESVELSDVEEILDRQISYNMAISQEGMRAITGRTSAGC